jgi:hypothetical protein
MKRMVVDSGKANSKGNGIGLLDTVVAHLGILIMDSNVTCHHINSVYHFTSKG